MSKRETRRQLRTILSEMYNARYGGVNAPRFYKAQGMADGYMRALSDLGIMDDAELIAFVNEEKRLAAARADRQLMQPSGASVEAAVEFA